MDQLEAPDIPVKGQRLGEMIGEHRTMRDPNRMQRRVLPVQDRRRIVVIMDGRRRFQQRIPGRIAVEDRFAADIDGTPVAYLVNIELMRIAIRVDHVIAAAGPGIGNTGRFADREGTLIGGDEVGLGRHLPTKMIEARAVHVIWQPLQTTTHDVARKTVDITHTDIVVRTAVRQEARPGTRFPSGFVKAADGLVEIHRPSEIADEQVDVSQPARAISNRFADGALAIDCRGRHRQYSVPLSARQTRFWK